MGEHMASPSGSACAAQDGASLTGRSSLSHEGPVPSRWQELLCPWRCGPAPAGGAPAFGAAREAVAPGPHVATTATPAGGEACAPLPPSLAGRQATEDEPWPSLGPGRRQPVRRGRPTVGLRTVVCGAGLPRPRCREMWPDGAARPGGPLEVKQNLGPGEGQVGPQTVQTV